MSNREKNSKLWLRIAVVAALAPWVGNLLISKFYQPYSMDMSVADIAKINGNISKMSGALTLVSLIALVLIVIALFHVKGKLKLIVIAGIVSTIYVGYMAFFSYTLLM